jgi:hypothetical protein
LLYLYISSDVPAMSLYCKKKLTTFFLSLMNIHEYLKKVYILFLFLGSLYSKDIIIFEILLIFMIF